MIRLPSKYGCRSRLGRRRLQNRCQLGALRGDNDMAYDGLNVFGHASDDTRGRHPGELNELRQSSMTQTESVMAELADGTGGTYFPHNNDLGAGFRALTDVPQCVYLIELSPDNMKANGSYHRLNVKVNRDGLQIQVRHGYFAPKPEKRK